jgi:hypothetical protein
MVRVAPKGSDVLVHPGQSLDNIQKPLIARASIVWSGQFFKVEKTQQPQAMVRLHDHNIKIARQIGSILMGCSARANDKTAAMIVEHDRSLPMVIGGRPDIEE